MWLALGCCFFISCCWIEIKWILSRYASYTISCALTRDLLKLWVGSLDIWISRKNKIQVLLKKMHHCYFEQVVELALIYKEVTLRYNYYLLYHSCINLRIIEKITIGHSKILPIWIYLGSPRTILLCCEILMV